MRAIILAWAALVLAVPSSPAQRKDTRHFPLERINVNGSARYSESAIIAELGLRTGQQTSQVELEQVSAKLGNSGLFQLVEFRFGWGTNGVVATFNVSDSTNLVPIGFENLVWFSPNELATAIKRKLPLFTGVVPLAGDFRDRIATALQEILAEHNVKGMVVALPHGSAGRIESMFYRVEGHEIKLTDCDFPGAAHANKLELFELAKYISANNFDKSFVEPTLESRLKTIYEDDGYLAIRSEAPEIKIVSSSPESTEISLTTRVNEGQQYRFSGVQWIGNKDILSEQLTKTVDFAPGQIASVPKFRKALAGARRLYQRRGHMGVNFELEPKLSSDGTAQFVVKIAEGDQYRMGELKLFGVDERTAVQMRSDWKMNSGDLYDPEYPQMFMVKFGKYASGRKWVWRNVESIHDGTKTVDVQIEVEFRK